MKDYRPLLLAVRLLVSLVAAIDININGHWYLAQKALKTPLFYLAFVVSFCISYLLLHVVHVISLRLDEKYPWNTNRRLRIIRQFMLGIPLPALADLLLISLYFVLTGRSQQIYKHIYYEYPRVVFFIATINLVYLIVSFMKRHDVRQKTIVIKHNGFDLQLDAHTEIIYIYKELRNVIIVTTNGNRYKEKATIAFYLKLLGKAGFCQINPGAIVNLKMLSGYITGTRSKTLEIVLKPTIAQKFTTVETEKLRVTREYISQFKAKMKKQTDA